MFEEVLARIRPSKDSANNTDTEETTLDGPPLPTSLSTFPGTTTRDTSASAAPPMITSPTHETHQMSKSSSDLLPNSSPIFFLDSQPLIQELQQAVPSAISKLRSMVLPDTLSIPLVRPFTDSSFRSKLLKPDSLPPKDDLPSALLPIPSTPQSLTSWTPPLTSVTQSNDRAFEKLEQFLVSFFQCCEQIEHFYRFREEEYSILRSIFLRKYKKWIFTT